VCGSGRQDCQVECIRGMYWCQRRQCWHARCPAPGLPFLQHGHVAPKHRADAHVCHPARLGEPLPAAAAAGAACCCCCSGGGWRLLPAALDAGQFAWRGSLLAAPCTATTSAFSMRPFPWFIPPLPPATCAAAARGGQQLPDQTAPASVDHPAGKPTWGAPMVPNGLPSPTVPPGPAYLSASAGGILPAL
jgi:hypothetical protein